MEFACSWKSEPPRVLPLAHQRRAHRQTRRPPEIKEGGINNPALQNGGGDLLEAVKTTILVVNALFPIVNPLGGSPIFLALTRECTRQARRMLAQQIAVNSFLLLISSLFTCSHML